MSYLKRLTNAALGRLQAFRMYGGIGMSASSLHRESTDSLIQLYCGHDNYKGDKYLSFYRVLRWTTELLEVCGISYSSQSSIRKMKRKTAPPIVRYSKSKSDLYINSPSPYYNKLCNSLKKQNNIFSSTITLLLHISYKC